MIEPGSSLPERFARALTALEGARRDYLRSMTVQTRRYLEAREGVVLELVQRESEAILAALRAHGGG